MGEVMGDGEHEHEQEDHQRLTPAQPSRAEREHYAPKPLRFRDSAVIGFTMAVSLFALLILFSVFAGRNQTAILNSIDNASRAQVCVLILPSDPETGRDEAQVNSQCLIPNGIEPVDADGDGQIETQGGGNP